MKTVPKMTTDAEAEAFLAQDLSSFDFSQFRPISCETSRKTARVNMRLPEALYRALNTKAAQRGLSGPALALRAFAAENGPSDHFPPASRGRAHPYQRLIREMLEREVAKP